MVEYINLINQMNNNWTDFKEYIIKNRDEKIEKIIFENHFAKNFDEVIRSVSLDLEVVSRNISPYYRGCGINEDIELTNFDRMIPKPEYVMEHNRMNPPNVAYIYLAANTNGKANQISTIESELRVKEGEFYTLCRFYSEENLKIIDITGDDSIPMHSEDFGNYMIAKIAKNKDMEVQKVVQKILANLYFNLFNNEEIFKPISREIDDISYEYAPFQFIARYFKELNYDGILYNSTVYKEGKNLVIFEPRKLEIDETSMKRITL